MADPGPRRQLPLTCGRILFVGDAAAATDVMTGEGIGQALLTGRLAAESIVAAGATPPDDGHRRLRAGGPSPPVRRPPDVEAARAGARHVRGRRGSIAVVAASGTWGRRNFARWMFEDEPRAVLLTPSRWHRGLLRQPGAFQTTA